VCRWSAARGVFDFRSDLRGIFRRSIRPGVNFFCVFFGWFPDSGESPSGIAELLEDRLQCGVGRSVLSVIEACVRSLRRRFVGGLQHDGADGTTRGVTFLAIFLSSGGHAALRC